MPKLRYRTDDPGEAIKVPLKKQEWKFTGQSYHSAPEWHEGERKASSIRGVSEKEVLKESIREQP